MSEKDSFILLIENSISQLDFHKRVAVEYGVLESITELHDKLITYFEDLKTQVTNRDLSINYIEQFKNDLSQTLSYLPYRHFYDNVTIFKDANLDEKQVRITFENQAVPLGNRLELMHFNLDFFKKLNFFNSNIVAIGANGSGKTTLSNNLKKYLPNTGVVISAQKVLIIPTFSGVSNFNNTSNKLQNSQESDKSLKVTYSTESNGNAYQLLVGLGGEFQILLDNLLAERSVIRNQFCDSIQSGQSLTSVPITKLDKALRIWNSLILHRTLECKDGINITLKTISSLENYPAHQMSDGEKVILYLIAHVLQAPLSGFIIIDEPEMYLHKTILNKLWDTLEQERNDCIFIYLTHDLDFATSRAAAKKIWIKSFTHPSNWEIENIPDNELPEPLLLELLGSRKNILFCEGKKGSIDEKIYNILFPNYTITPVDNCFAVINYTKAFNKLPAITTKAFGLIDSDYHGAERLSVLERENIYSFSMTEPENLFFDESFLIKMTEQLLINSAVIDLIKLDIIKQLQNEIELQVSNYVSTKINYYFKDSHVSKGNTISMIKDNYIKFTNEIKIEEWYDQRKSELDEMINDSNYTKILSVYNNKGLRTIANKHLKISDFIERSIRLLLHNSETHLMLKKYFPEVLIEN
jgi:ABC-type cobalamin/Fe3+-siderophores transport system ATPase subunit